MGKHVYCMNFSSDATVEEHEGWGLGEAHAAQGFIISQLRALARFPETQALSTSQLHRSSWSRRR